MPVYEKRISYYQVSLWHGVSWVILFFDTLFLGSSKMITISLPGNERTILLYKTALRHVRCCCHVHVTWDEDLYDRTLPPLSLERIRRGRGLRRLSLNPFHYHSVCSPEVTPPNKSIYRTFHSSKYRKCHNDPDVLGGQC